VASIIVMSASQRDIGGGRIIGEPVDFARGEFVLDVCGRVVNKVLA
jgi:hypothetical protein